MMLPRLFLQTLLLRVAVASLTVPNGERDIAYKVERNAVITWDSYSFLINDERLMIYSGEFHPWRLPVASLWFDVLQKIKAMGFNTVSVYMHWGLVEHTNGTVRFDGIFSFDEFFTAAKDVGLWVIARPGPYINAETTSGGFPGWRQHAPEGIQWRVDNPSYYAEFKAYIDAVSTILAPQQITEGGPLILLQLENELSSAAAPNSVWPPLTYMEFLSNEYRNNGLTVPTFHNDVSHGGVWSSTPVPDIYAYDYYPLGCGSLPSSLPQSDWTLYQEYSPTRPHMIAECGDGFYDTWGGVGYANCPPQLDAGIERLFYKNRYSQSVTSLNLYMIFGGTNWGHIAWHQVYTSYDYRAAIAEDRSITREKYSGIKLEAQFLKVSPAYLTSRLLTFATPAFTSSPSVVATQTRDNSSATTFWTTRRSTWSSTANVTYLLNIPTSAGNLSIPQLGGSLSMSGYDSKIHVSDYQIGDYNMLYSTAEIFTWRKFDVNTTVVLYGTPGEIHETAVISASTSCTVLEGSINTCKVENGTVIVNYITNGQTVVSIGSDILLYIVDRNIAYTFWVPELPTGTIIPAISSDAVIVKGPYLVRSAEIVNSAILLTGDLNATVLIEVIAPSNITEVQWNGINVTVTRSNTGSLRGTLRYTEPSISLPVLAKLDWRTRGSIPEINPGYDDSEWIVASNTTTVNQVRGISTPTDLYSGTYGYHVGNQVYRGHFVATGNETDLYLQISGGFAFGYSVWVNSTFMGSYTGGSTSEYSSTTFDWPFALAEGSYYALTILTENMGYNENESGGITWPRGVLNYNLGAVTPNVTWKIIGNTGGEYYADLVRGPLNEGGLYAERQGWHLPSPPSSSWAYKSPFTGATASGVEIFTATFDLDLDPNYDIPLAVTIEGTVFLRAHLFINGYKFGRYIQNIGPQTVFPVPEGIMNHQDTNTIAVILWNLNADGGYLTNLTLGATGAYLKGYGSITASPQPAYSFRSNAL